MKKICVYFALLLLSCAAHGSEIWIAYNNGTPKEILFEVTRNSTVKDIMERFRTKTGFGHRYDVKFKLGDMVLKPNDSMNFVMNLAETDHPLISAKITEKLPTMPEKIQ
jgi:hypothetical protein